VVSARREAESSDSGMRHRFMQAQADLAELNLRHRRSELIHRHEVEGALAAAFGRGLLRGALAGVVIGLALAMLGGRVG
jgi:hypothetical protein